MVQDKAPSLDRLAESVERFVAGPPPEVTPFQLGERLIRIRHILDILELRFAREAAAFATTEEAIAQGSTSAIDWVRHQCRMSGSAAARSIATGETADELPASVAALDEGAIGFAHLALLAGTARALQRSGGASCFDERPLLDLRHRALGWPFRFRLHPRSPCRRCRRSARRERHRCRVAASRVLRVRGRSARISRARSTRWVAPPFGSRSSRSAAASGAER